MGWRYVLVNHTLKEIVYTYLSTVWQHMAELMVTEGWKVEDNVVILFEEEAWDEIKNCVVKLNYRSEYRPDTFREC